MSQALIIINENIEKILVVEILLEFLWSQKKTFDTVDYQTLVRKWNHYGSCGVTNDGLSSICLIIMRKYPQMFLTQVLLL